MWCIVELVLELYASLHVVINIDAGTRKSSDYTICLTMMLALRYVLTPDLIVLRPLISSALQISLPGR